MGVDAITVPDIPDLKQRGPEAQDNYCDKLGVVQAQSFTDTDTGLASKLNLALPLEVQTQVKAQAKAKARHQHHSWICRSRVF